MSRSSIIATGFVVGWIVGSAMGQEPPSVPSPPPAVAARYKGVFWYELGQPVATWKHQTYDRDRGEYDEGAVARWLETLRATYPGHGAYLRDIRTDDVPGETEADRLARAIDRERQRWANLNRRPSPMIPDLIARPAPRLEVGRRKLGDTRPGSLGRAGLGRTSPGSAGIRSGLPSSPFPYPYRSGPR